jgi:hypothetical protein
MRNDKTKALSTFLAAAAAASSDPEMNQYFDYDKEIHRIMENEYIYAGSRTMSIGPSVKSKKTLKARKKNKMAKQSRKKNRK